ncbi:MAG TPA: SMP-30/gluconolactonase/LRE family protein [Candidatus Saccharimonadales bacterium]|nr:SMP-30/gluconolactonase/LRE family protein [Candidatus Saccharimonadales bacterium]
MRAVLIPAGFFGVLLVGFALFTAQTVSAVQFQISDAVQFSNIIDTNAVFTTNATINSQIEGPVWIPNGQFLVFSDMGNNKLKKLDPSSNLLSDYFLPPLGAKYNGNILDLQECLISCEAGSNGFKVVMTTNVVVGTSSGAIVPLVTNCNGLKFISPNDVCVKSDGSIWFTDTGSDSGITLGTHGYQPGYYVYRFYETNGNATVVPVITNGIQRPNGICFSPDETKLYVADDGPSFNLTNIWVYSVTSSNTLAGGKIFCSVGGGFADGFRCDADGRIWSTAGDGVEIFAPDGHLIGKILMGSARPNNLCFGGSQYNTLYTVGNPNVCSFPVLVAGAVSIKKLIMGFDGSQVNVSWPAPSTGFGLQSSATLDATAAWSDVTDPPLVTNGLNQVSLDPTNAAEFFRLRLN